MTWSRIQNIELATEAYVLMNENEMAGCQYHNNQHIEEMYQYLEDTDEPYDEALDWVVMFHDVVYDEKPMKEERSAKLFFDLVYKYRGCNMDTNDIDRVQLLIMETEHHKVTDDVYLEGSSAIIRADLHALASKVDTINNFTKIMNESMSLYGCTIEEFATNNIQFMTGLHQRVATNSLVDIEHKELYSKIIKGIELTIRLAKALKDAE